MSVPDSSGRVRRKLDAYNAIRIKSHIGVKEDSLAVLNRKYTADNMVLLLANRFSNDHVLWFRACDLPLPARRP